MFYVLYVFKLTGVTAGTQAAIAMTRVMSPPPGAVPEDIQKVPPHTSQLIVTQDTSYTSVTFFDGDESDNEDNRPKEDWLSDLQLTMSPTQDVDLLMEGNSSELDQALTESDIVPSLTAAGLLVNTSSLAPACEEDDSRSRSEDEEKSVDKAEDVEHQ